MKNEIKEKKYSELPYIIILCLCVTAVLVICHAFTKQWFWKGQPYNSYILQVQSWLSGRLDLGQDYPYLELAIFDGKYFVSFPPFPSYVLLPFVAFGWTTCDGIITFAFSLAGAVYAYKLMRQFEAGEKISLFFALFVTVGSNWLMTAQNAWVWFIAQNMAFTLNLMAVYYALKNKAGLSLLFWACAVGCRPLTAVYIPLLAYIIYKEHKIQNSRDIFWDMIKKRWLAAVPMLIVAVSYMILNYKRFGSITEFGHNYLPEFMRVETGQFNVAYIHRNFPSLFRLPTLKNGKITFPMADGMCLFLASPIFISYIVYTIHSLIKKEKDKRAVIIMTFVLTFIYLILLTAHKTMGGSHFGNRYTNDTLPFVFLAIALLYKKSRPVIFNYPLFALGLLLNMYGTIIYFIG